MFERIKIFFPDETYRTVKVDQNTTVQDICDKCCPRKNLDPKEHTLQFTEFILEGSPTNNSFQKALSSFDILLDILNNASRNSMCRFNVIHFNQVPKESDLEGSEHFDDADIVAMGYQKQGWMEKLGVETLGVRINLWRRNYFVLDGDELRYWKSLDDFKSRRRHPRGKIELQDPWAHVKIDSEEPKDNKWLFQLVTKRKVIQLRVNTYRHLVEWSNALHRPPPQEQLIFEALQSEINKTEYGRADEFQRWITELSDMKNLLSHRRANDAFLRFLRNENREMWLLFLIDVEDFRNQTDGNILMLNAEKILKQYIECTRQNNKYFPCSEEMKHFIVQKINSNEVTSALFDELYSILFHTLHDDYFGHFLRSRNFLKLLSSLSHRRILWDQFSSPKQKAPS